MGRMSGITEGWQHNVCGLPLLLVLLLLLSPALVAGLPCSCGAAKASVCGSRLPMCVGVHAERVLASMLAQWGDTACRREPEERAATTGCRTVSGSTPCAIAPPTASSLGVARAPSNGGGALRGGASGWRNGGGVQASEKRFACAPTQRRGPTAKVGMGILQVAWASSGLSKAISSSSSSIAMFSPPPSARGASR